MPGHGDILPEIRPLYDVHHCHRLPIWVCDVCEHVVGRRLADPTPPPRCQRRACGEGDRFERAGCPGFYFADYFYEKDQPAHALPPVPPALGKQVWR